MEPPPVPQPPATMQSAAAQYQPSDPTAGPSSVTLDSFPHSREASGSNGTAYATGPVDSTYFDSQDSAYDPSFPNGPPRGRGRGRGRGRNRIVEYGPDGVRIPRKRGRPRGRGRGGWGGESDRTTRQSSRVKRWTGDKVGKVKISLRPGVSASGAADIRADGRLNSFLGEYDRELDGDATEPLEFEEQFILRVPKEVEMGRGGEVGLREMIKGKGKGLEGIEFKFLDARRAAFKINGHTYASRLVDLPNIIEAQKTHDSRHLFKIADISQMLVVEKRIPDESAVPPPTGNPEEYIWPHGITPPMRHVRKRRFRQRLSRRAIEVVEEQVEELLKRDEEADTAEAEFVEMHPDPNAPDSEYLNFDKTVGWQIAPPETRSEFGETEAYGDPGSVAPSEMQWDYEGEEEEEDEHEEGEFEEDEDYDEDLAAALMEQMGEDAGEEAESGSDEDGLMMSDDDGEEDDGEGGGEEEDEENAEKRAKARQLASEIKALEGAIEKKKAGFQGGNPIMMKRFEETIAGMQNDITLKATARQAILDEIDKDKPQPVIQVTAPTAATLPEKPAANDGAAEESDDDLFGDDDEEEEEEDAEGGTDASASASRSRTPGSTDMPPPLLPGQVERVPSKLSIQEVATPASATGIAADGDADADGETENEGEDDADGESVVDTDAGTEAGDAQSVADADAEGEDEEDEDAEGDEEEEEEPFDHEMFDMLNAADTADAPAPEAPSTGDADVVMSDSAQAHWGIEGGAGRRRRAEGLGSASGSESSSSDDSD